MELVKDKWTKNDIKNFQNYLKSFENAEKRDWATNLLQTELPVLCIKTVTMKNIINKIYEGNYMSFLDLMIWEYYENTAINGFLIIKINDFNVMKKYLDIYSEMCDNWASCDLLTFNVVGNEKKYLDLVLEYVKSSKPFKRRIGMSILFNFIDDDVYIYKIFELLDDFENEENYYVNMMNAWLICECYIKQKDKTLKYLDCNRLNKFTINKAIQKCRESRRVNLEERETLLKYKIK